MTSIPSPFTMPANQINPMPSFSFHRILGLLLCLVAIDVPHFNAQTYGLEVETFNDDIGVLVGALGAIDMTGYACYRAYITMENEDDFLSSISGDSSNPTYVTTTTSFYQAALGGPTPNGINSLLFPVYPDLAYDSWVSIGLEGVPNAVAGEAAVSTVQSSINPWTTNFDPGGGMDGASIIIDDANGGAWFALNGDANGVAGTDLKVLAGQFTTDGTLSLQLYTQIFINGNGLNQVLVNGELPTYIWSYVEGCADETACNYNPDAGVDDGSCTYPAETYLDCDDNCINDADGDGLCDELETAGCTEMGACNYNPMVTVDDGSCDFSSCQGCTDSMACNYDPEATIDDGACESISCAGCTDSGACNHDMDATIDDGTCDYSCIGCTDLYACNYDMSATVDSGDCTYPAASYVDCDGNCYNDEDGDGLCDEEEGCGDPEACNFDPTAAIVEADYCLIVDTVAVHTTGSLAGMTTYRYYVKCLNAADFVSSVSGDVMNPTVVTTTTDFYQDELGGWTPNGITPFLYGTFPNLQYDSWVTIGLDSQPDVASGESNVSTVQGSANPWLTNFEPGFGTPGGNIQIDDPVGGSWYALNGDANGIAANSPNQHVLIAQLTTSGDVAGNFYVQVFVNGSGSNQLFFNFNIGDACIAPDDDCQYPEDLYGNDYVDCDGNCLIDTDEDGICDVNEIPGCTDMEALNYNEDATDEDGSCTYPAASVFDIIAESPAHTVLESLIVGAGLDSTLTFDGDWTVFAPTDLAVDALPDVVVNYVLNNPDVLLAVLTYHVSAGVTTSDMLSNNMEVPMINGETATITFSGGNIFIEGAQIIIADLIAENGVVHVIDAVIVPAIEGCTNVESCNYNPLASTNDGSCESISCAGCLNPAACNYDSTATIPDAGSCTFPIDLWGVDYVDCNGNCLPGLAPPGVCGCMDSQACNYDADAIIDTGCLYPEDLYGSPYLDCNGDCACASGGGAESGAIGGYGLEVQVVNDDIGVLVGALGATDLTGYTCYRAYITMENENDFLSSISGDMNYPTYVNTTASFYHSALGGPTPNGINSLLFQVYPDLAYDSWVSIGLEGVPNAVAGEAAVSTVQSSANPWTTNFDPGGGMPGASIVINDLIGGSWYALNGDANGVAGADLKVLAGQFTTTGNLTMQLHTQIFINGVGGNQLEVNGTLPTFYWPSQGAPGCTDPLAENYCSCAEEDDGSCEYILGCTDTAACTFEADATLDDGSCLYPIDIWGSELYDCDGNCLGAPPGTGFVSGSAPGEYGLQVEVYSSNIGVLIGALGIIDLSGYTTYRAYITMENENDFLSAISGDIINPTWVMTTTDFYQAELGSATPMGINSLLFPVFPDLEYDSWVTIGLDGVADPGAGEADVSIGQSATNPWIDAFDPGGGAPGGDIIINDFFGGYWFALNGDANGVAGADLRVLAGQFTTTGNLDMGLHTQIFIEGEGLNEYFIDGERPTFTWSSGGGTLLEGCTDEAACNFLECAVEDDGSCTYPEVAYLDCAGNCLNDSDGDGICDEEEECSDPAACDYDGSEPEAAPYCLVLDTVAVHTTGTLSGMTTYRLSLRCENETDFVSAVAGYSDFPTRLMTTTAFYQDQLGGPTPNGIYPTLFAAFPDLQYDSWVTIGLSQAPDPLSGEGEVNTIQNNDFPWLTDFDPGFGVPGSSIIMEDLIGGSWFSLIGDANAYASYGDDQEILLAQLTTDGVLSGELYIQVFIEGNGQNIEYLTLEIGGGCYLPDSDCSYPIDEYGVDHVDCDGNCLHDTDGDGVCDEDEIPGCTDSSACNYNEEATDDNGGCSYLEAFVESLPVSCYGEDDGQLLLDIEGGIAPFAITISGFPTVQLNAPSFVFDNVPPGLYTIQVGDAAGCETPVFPFSVEEPELLGFDVDFVANCASPGGEPVHLYAYGGTPPYDWHATGDSTISWSSSEGFLEVFLLPGDWTLGVTDASGCEAGGLPVTIDACLGCTDSNACNFDALAYEDDGTCFYPISAFYDCDGNCFNDSDEDGVCDEDEVPGCTWPYACNYDPEATDENGSCFMASVFFDCEGNCQLDLNDNGICDFYEDFTSGTAYCGPGTIWDPEVGACVASDDCPTDVNNDGYIGMEDLLDLLSDFATFCE